jgi:hypothetical protein
LRLHLKKLILIGLLFALFLQAGGLLVAYRFQQHLIRARMARMIESESPHTEMLSISLEDYLACRIDRREIRFKGSLYDVVSLKYTDEGVELKVIRDSQEEEVAAKIRLMEDRTGKQQNQDLPDQVLKLYSQVYLSPGTHEDPLIGNAIDTKYPILTENYHFIFGGTLSPPPKTA